MDLFARIPNLLTNKKIIKVQLFSRIICQKDTTIYDLKDT